MVPAMAPMKTLHPALGGFDRSLRTFDWQIKDWQSQQWPAMARGCAAGHLVVHSELEPPVMIDLCRAKKVPTLEHL